MKYSIVTFGCRVNQADSLRIEEALRARGAIDAPAFDADLVVVNTCSVTAAADQGARQTIRRIARDNPNVRVVVTGCYATRCESDVAALPNVLRVVRNDDKERLVDDVLGNAGLDPDERTLRVADPGLRAGPRAQDGDGPCGSAIEPGL